MVKCIHLAAPIPIGTNSNPVQFLVFIYSFVLLTLRIHNTDTNGLISCRYNQEIQRSYTTTSSLVLTLMARRIKLGMSPLPEWLKGDLQSGTRVWNLEFLENRGV